MPFVPTHATRYDLVQYYVKLYYREAALYPARVKTQEGRLEVLDRLNEEYQEVLAKKYCEWDTEEMRGKFEEMMDFLTNAFSIRRRQIQMFHMRKKLLKDTEATRQRNERQALERRVLEGIIKKDNIK